MAFHDVFVEVEFTDAAERTAKRVYLLNDQYDDVGLNMEDITDQAADLVTALSVLTWDQIARYTIQVENLMTGALSPNISSNNQVTAFVRTLITSGAETGDSAYFEVPAWDDFTYDEDSNNLLSPAFELAAAAVALFTRDPDTRETWSVQWAQSRTRKSGARLG
jgi:hypothetical protein